MASSPPETVGAAARHLASSRNLAFAQAIETSQTVLTALILAFMFRAFFLEAFVIPTGSMAESLLGAHGTIVCPQCGWEYDYGPSQPTSEAHPAFNPPSQLRCPNCYYRVDISRRPTPHKSGDRILVHKWPYLLGLGPQRWDVIVFRDPANPRQNFIKRLVGLPGERVEIIDGDVYIDGEIVQKTPAAQSVLWLTVADQRYLPVEPETGTVIPFWVTAPRNDPAGWTGLETRRLRFDPVDDQRHSIRLSDETRGRLRDTYGYNGPFRATEAYVGDVRLRAECRLGTGPGTLSLELWRDGRAFRARFSPTGAVTLGASEPREMEVEPLSEAHVPAIESGETVVLELGHLDAEAYVAVNGVKVLHTTPAQYSLPREDRMVHIRTDPVELVVTARQLDVTVTDLRVERDVHYQSGTGVLRGRPGEPVELGRDEYFVLGDNSPNSVDSRKWARVGPHLRERFEAGEYQLGTVPADQIVGKAFFVYLPGLMPLDAGGYVRIPDLGRVRFIR